MKLGTILGLLIPLTLAAGIAQAADVGYVDMTKVIGGTADGKKAVDQADADAKAKQADVSAAQAAAEKASGGCLKLTGAQRTACDQGATQASQHAQQLVQRYNKELQDRKNAQAAQMYQRAIRILPAIAAAHKLTQIQDSTGVLFVAPKLDFTAEVIKRYDAGEGKSGDEIATELREKNQALEKEVAELKAASAKPAAVAANTQPKTGAR